MLREHRAALELVRLSLRERGSPYAHLLDAVCQTLGAASAGRARSRRPSSPPTARRSELVGLEPFAPPEVMPERGGETMSAGKILLWIILPYVAITTFVGRPLVALPPRPVRLDQPLHPAARPPLLGWASPLFHYGALAAIGGHVIGLRIPRVADRADRHLRELLPLVRRRSPAGSPALVTLVGFLGLVYRRTTSHRVRAHHHAGWTCSPTSC